MQAKFSSESFTLKTTVLALLKEADSPEGFFTFIYDAAKDTAKGAYSMDGFVKVAELQPSEVVVNVTIPEGFRSKRLAAEALYSLTVNNLTYLLPGLALKANSEDALRREIRAVRDLAIHASELDLVAEEAFFDDMLVSLKKTLRPLVEARQEKIKEQQHAALWI